MDHKKYMKRLKELSDELQAAGTIRPYDPDNYNRIVDELNALIQNYIESPTGPASPSPFSNWFLRKFAVARLLRKISKKGVT